MKKNDENKNQLERWKLIMAKYLAKVIDNHLSVNIGEEKEFCEFVFPFWRDAVHEIMIFNGCSCVEGDRLDCFLSLNPQNQKRFFAGDKLLSLESFSTLVKTALIK